MIKFPLLNLFIETSNSVFIFLAGKKHKNTNQRKLGIATLMTDEVHLGEKARLQIKIFHNGNALVKYYNSKYVCPNKRVLRIHKAKQN